VKISANITPDDYRDFLLSLGALFPGKFATAVALLSVIGTVAFLIVSIVSLAVILWAIAFQNYGATLVAILLEQPYLLASLLLIIPALIIAVLWLRWVYRFQGKARQQSKEGLLDPSYLRDGINVGDAEFNFDDREVSITLKLVHETYAWRAFRMLRETDKSLLLMIDEGSGLIIPKRAVGNGDALRKLTRFIKSRIGVQT
jgi:hypothetical protein